MTLEKNLSQLESIADKLETDDIDLDDAVKQYSKAIKIASESFKALKKTDKTLTVLKKEQDDLIQSTVNIDD